MIKKVFCEHCLDDVTYRIIKTELTRSLKGKDYTFQGQEALCVNCQKPVFAEEVDESNRQALYASYRKVHRLISVTEIKDILQKYAISAKPLSELLGWGINTLPRYLKGDIPKSEYSSRLYRILNEPDYFFSLLKSSSDVLTDVAYKKSLQATEKLLAEGEVAREVMVANYLLSQNDEITPLALQKLLYYVQGFAYAFIGKFIFESNCESWVHGPVYRDIYEKYQEFGWQPIVLESDYDYRHCFTDQEIQVLDSVIYHLSVYNGKVLEKFTHEESPWLLTRGDLKEDEPSTVVIEKKLIADFFERVRDKYDMLTVDDIATYSNERFSRLHF